MVKRTGLSLSEVEDEITQAFGRKMEGPFSFELEQGGIVVAAGDATSFDDVRREGCHYAAMYAQDGPVLLSFRDSKGKLIPDALQPAPADTQEGR